MPNAEEIFAIERECFSPPWSKKSIKAELESPFCVSSFIYKDEKLVGFSLGRVIAGEAELLRVAVLKEYRRQGKAEKLLLELFSKMRGAGGEVCFLEVRSRNLPAVSLYQKLGFEKLRIIPHYYPDDDGITMKLSLD